MSTNFGTYRIEFMKIWLQCIAAGYTTQDARKFAELEMESRILEIRKRMAMKDTLS